MGAVEFEKGRFAGFEISDKCSAIKGGICLDQHNELQKRANQPSHDIDSAPPTVYVYDTQ